METLRSIRLAAQSPILLGGDRLNVLMPIPYVSNLLSQTPPTPAQLATLKIATGRRRAGDRRWRAVCDWHGCAAQSARCAKSRQPAGAWLEHVELQGTAGVD